MGAETDANATQHLFQPTLPKVSESIIQKRAQSQAFYKHQQKDKYKNQKSGEQQIKKQRKIKTKKINTEKYFAKKAKYRLCLHGERVMGDRCDRNSGKSFWPKPLIL